MMPNLSFKPSRVADSAHVVLNTKLHTLQLLASNIMGT